MKSPLQALVQKVLLAVLRAYQLAISPMLGQNCRFYPTCSNYALQAIREHGACKGSLLAGKRLCKCHPWHPGGVDLVPPGDENSKAAPNSEAVSSVNPISDFS
jgi:putative membrane protein insertion efficiency factor